MAESPPSLSKRRFARARRLPYFVFFSAQGGSKVCCGTAEGSLAIYSWGDWEDCDDRIPGHTQSVDSVVKITEDILYALSPEVAKIVVK